MAFALFAGLACFVAINIYIAVRNVPPARAVDLPLATPDNETTQPTPDAMIRAAREMEVKQ